RDELLRIGIGQRIEEHAVDDGEDGGVGADAEGKSEDRDEGEPGILAQRARAVAQILEEFFEPEPAPLVAGNLLHQLNVAKFATGGLLGTVDGFAALRTVVRGHLQMGLQLLLQLLLLALALPRKFHAWPPRLAGLRTPAMASESCSQRERSESNCFFPVALRR